MKRAVVYTRFSPRRNADKSESCEVQREYCQKYAAAHDMEIAETFDDPDVSGADEFREKLWNAVQSLGKGDVLLVYKRDRLARNVYLSEQINRAVQKRGATIEAVTGDVKGDTPETQMIRQVLASIAEYERKMIADRTRHAMRFHMRNGKRMGGSDVPYGYSPDPADPTRTLVNPVEQELIEDMKRMRANGATYWAIVRWLNENYRKRARHGSWNVKTVRKIILRTW